MGPKDRIDDNVSVTSDDGETYIGRETVVTYDDEGNQNVEVRDE